jgi:Double-GTPase 2
MIKEGTLELDSYRLAQYAVQVPCYICDGGNTFDAELCRHCCAPMALAHQANSQGLHPQMMAAIGSTGCGKTVYLGMLMDMLSRQSERLHMVARGAFSITLQQTTAAALARNEFPVKTPTEPDRWNWVHAQVRSPRHKRPVELIMPDMAGESLIEEVDHPRTYQVIRSLLSKCASAILMIDTAKLRGGSLDQDYFAMKLLSYLTELDNHPKHGWTTRPVAVLFSKADEWEECFDNPAGFAAAHAPGVWQHAQERFRNVKFFATGVAGGCAYRVTREGRIRVPLRVEPRGILDPFEWLMSQLK